MTVSQAPVALITGAASGIGWAIARKLVAAGARLALIDRDEAALAARAADLSAQTEVQSHCFDISDELAWDAATLAIQARFGGLDWAVANAGVAASGAIAELSLADWRTVMAVNLDGAFLTLRTALRLIRPGGAIVLLSSAAALKAEPGVAAYGASKAGALHLARVAAKEAAPQGVRVNTILPGGVETPIWSGLPFFQDLVREHGGEAGAYAALAGADTPLGRFAKPDEIADLALFVLRDAPSMTGAGLVVDNGYLL